MTPHLVFVTQVVDPDDPVLGVVHEAMVALAEECRLTIIANSVRTFSPALHDRGVRIESLGQERGAARSHRAVVYQRALGNAFRRENATALLAHMCPTYLIQAAPLAALSRARLLMWFAHWRDSAELRIAERLSDVVLTSLPGAYPRFTPKLQIIGQAIATARFESVPPATRGDRLRLLAVGRTSPAKQFDLLIDALRDLRNAGLDAELRIVGPSTTAAEIAYRDQLAKQVADLGLDAWVTLAGPHAPNALPNVFADCDIMISATAAGTGDKSVFEAMAAGRPVIASNPSFTTLLANCGVDLMFAEGDRAGVIDRIRAVAALPAESAANVGSELRLRVQRDHATEGWARAVVDAAFG